VVFVNAAKSKSVPTAVAGLKPKRNTKSGVINEPPPTPVSPTKIPTNNPEITYPKFNVKTNVIGVINAFEMMLLKSILFVQLAIILKSQN
jgi:hypothetical protein